MKTIFLFIALSCLLSSGLCAQDSSTYTLKPQKNKLAAGLLATAVPGLGHMYVDRPKRALVFFASETAVLVGFFYFAFSPGLLEDNRKGDQSAANLLITAYPLLKVWEIVDVVKCANEFNNRNVSLGVAPLGNKTFGLSVQYHF